MLSKEYGCWLTIISKAMVRGSLMGVLAAFLCTSVCAQSISGAGATFPYSVYSHWAPAYQQQTGVNVKYLSI